MSTQAPVVAQRADPVRPMVFYDGGCPLCRREIAHYRRIDSTGSLRWVDAMTEQEGSKEAADELIAQYRSMIARTLTNVGHQHVPEEAEE